MDLETNETQSDLVSRGLMMLWRERSTMDTRDVISFWVMVCNIVVFPTSLGQVAYAYESLNKYIWQLILEFFCFYLFIYFFYSSQVTS